MSRFPAAMWLDSKAARSTSAPALLLRSCGPRSVYTGCSAGLPRPENGDYNPSRARPAAAVGHRGVASVNLQSLRRDRSGRLKIVSGRASIGEPVQPPESRVTPQI